MEDSCLNICLNNVRILHQETFHLLLLVHLNCDTGEHFRLYLLSPGLNS
jgi:hypothetical protein